MGCNILIPKDKLAEFCRRELKLPFSSGKGTKLRSNHET